MKPGGLIAPSRRAERAKIIDMRLWVRTHRGGTT